MRNHSLNRVKKKSEEYAISEVSFFQWISHQIAYDFITRKKYILIHETDPKWDASGSLRVDQFGFNVKDYEKVADFLQEYDGHSYATYVSGHGLKYTTYYDRYIKKLKKLDVHHSNSESMLEEIGKIDFLFLYRKGKYAAEKQIQQEIKRELEEQENREVARKQWNLLEKKHKLMFQRPIPKRIKDSNYEAFNQFLSEQNVSKEEWAFVARYAPVSVSQRVRSKLRFG